MSDDWEKDQYDEQGRKIADIYTLPWYLQLLAAILTGLFLWALQYFWPNEGVYYFAGAAFLVMLGYRLGTGKWP